VVPISSTPVLNFPRLSLAFKFCKETLDRNFTYYLKFNEEYELLSYHITQIYVTHFISNILFENRGMTDMSVKCCNNLCPFFSTLDSDSLLLHISIL